MIRALLATLDGVRLGLCHALRPIAETLAAILIGTCLIWWVLSSLVRLAANR